MWNIICNFAADFKMRYCVHMEILMAIGLISGAMVLLCVGVLFRKDHSFRSQHIHENERMKKDNIHCALAEDKIARRERKSNFED